MVITNNVKIIPPIKISLSCLARFSIRLIVVFDKPRVFAKSIILLRAPFITSPWFLRFDKILEPANVTLSLFKLFSWIFHVDIYLPAINISSTPRWAFCIELWWAMLASSWIEVCSGALLDVNLLFNNCSLSCNSCCTLCLLVRKLFNAAFN